MKKIIAVTLTVLLLLTVSVAAAKEAPVMNSVVDISLLTEDYSDRFIDYDHADRTLTIKKTELTLTGSNDNLTVVLTETVGDVILENCSIHSNKEFVFGTEKEADYFVLFTVYGSNELSADNSFIFNIKNVDILGNGSLTIKGTGKIQNCTTILKGSIYADIQYGYDLQHCIFSVSAPVNITVENGPFTTNQLNILDGTVLLKNGAQVDSLMLDGDLTVTQQEDYGAPENERFSLIIWDRLYFDGGRLCAEPYPNGGGSIRYRGCNTLNTPELIDGQALINNSMYTNPEQYHSVTDRYEAVIPKEEPVEEPDTEPAPLQDYSGWDEESLVLDVSALENSRVSYEIPHLWSYDHQTFRLTLSATSITLTGTNESISIAPDKGVDSITLQDLNISSRSAKCVCDKNDVFCSGKTTPQPIKIYIKGNNTVNIASGSALYWVSDSLELYGNGKIIFTGNGFAFSSPSLSLYINGPVAEFSSDTDYKDITVIRGMYISPHETIISLILIIIIAAVAVVAVTVIAAVALRKKRNISKDY